MLRTKTVARKRQRSSAGQAGPSSAQPHYPTNLRWEHEAKYDAVKKKKVLKPNVLVNWGLVARYGFAAQFDHFFEDPAWQNLLAIQEETYAGLTYEFIATFRISFPRVNGLNNPVSFYCQGRYYTVGMRDFIKCLAIYDEDFVDSDEFAQLPYEFP